MSLNLGAGIISVTKFVTRRLGLEVRRSSLDSRDDLRLVHYLNLHAIESVLDVGANTGQFASMLFDAGYQGRVVSFEPLPDAHEVLTKNARESGKPWIVAPRVALGDKEGTAQFHITHRNTASSLFTPREDLVSATPGARVVRTIEVRTVRLDDAVSDMSLPKGREFLKLDVQGAESLVIAGAPNFLSTATGVMLELSLTPLYLGQPPASEVLKGIYASGFEIWDVWQGYRNPETARLRQVDLLCFRASLEGS